MNERPKDPEIEQLRTEEEQLLAQRSNQVWHEALKEIDPNYRNEYTITFTTKRRCINVTGTERREIEYNRFKRTLIGKAIDTLTALGKTITPHSVSSFLSRGNFSIAKKTIWEWLKDSKNTSDDPNLTDRERVQRALLTIWSQQDRMQPPTNREIAEAGGLTESQVENAFRTDARKETPFRNLGDLREMGPKRSNKR